MESSESVWGLSMEKDGGGKGKGFSQVGCFGFKTDKIEKI